MGADSYLGPTKYRIRCRCLRCGHEYNRIVAKLTDKDPLCPKKVCKVARAAEERVAMERNFRAMIEAERGPGHIGNNTMVKAVDKTAEIVQADYGLTNLKDNIRQGDICAPRLPPRMQDAADNFFSGKINTPGMDARRKRQMDLMGKRAMAGAFRNMALNPGAVVPGQAGQAGLRLVGTEKLK